MRVAIIHDWLTGRRGGEKCLEILIDLFPDSEVFTLHGDFDAVNSKYSAFPINQSFLHHLPSIKKYYRFLLPIFPVAVWHLSRKLTARHAYKAFDLVISVSHCGAKNVKLPDGIPHLCYCLTPMRYAWDQFDRYFDSKWYKPLASVVCKYLARWDKRNSINVDRYVAISEFVKERINKCYGVSSAVVYPPVETGWLETEKKVDSLFGEHNYLCVSAMVPYKNIHLIVEAFNQMQLPLTVVGDGPERTGLEQMASPKIEFLGRVSDPELAWLYRSSKALLFAAEEDFGMVPVEAQAAGLPVIAYGKGGALETLSKESAEFFDELSVKSVVDAVSRFENRSEKISRSICRKNAAQFDRGRFEQEFARQLGEMGFPSIAELTEPVAECSEKLVGNL